MKVELKHIASYIPYKVQVQYIGVLNGKELSVWDKDNKNLDFFDEPSTQRPEEVKGLKLGFIKKIETYKNHQFLRVGNGHKIIGFWEFGENCFLVLRPLHDLNNDVFDYIYNNETDFVSISKWIELDVESRLSSKFSYIFWELLFKNNFDVFGLIENNLAIDINKLEV